ncbi:GDSL-type esterase/lipase family protein [Rhodopirellula sp. MGV]|uniref:GDSL-type esterase/lipase family protein n=1 Tax=Rhodopirellula sp. MGV TaxID=2023130 RepID=UPI00117B6C28|nr:GDSL-type esterase/lipase family protein [Rhodopirellula sp. MGV]
MARQFRLVVVRFAVLVLVSCGVAASAQDDARPSGADSPVITPHVQEATQRWEKDIAAFDSLNDELEPSDEAILFIGSSSIRRWETMQRDMSPYRTIRRGYGGAKFTDMAVYAERVITPHQYRAVVMFVGNGITAGPDSHSPELIEQMTRHIVDVAHQHRPDAPFFLIEITPTQSRFGIWDKVRKVNERLREIALTTPNTYFIETAGNFLHSDTKPRTELFVNDQLHLNEAGYRLWSDLIRRRLDDVFRMIAAE